MSKTSPGFFRRHKALVLTVLFLVLLLAWFHWPRPLLTGRTLRLAQNEASTNLRVWQYTDGEPADVTDQIDRAALIDRLSRTRCVRYLWGRGVARESQMRYLIDVCVRGRPIYIRLGAYDPDLTINSASILSSGLLQISYYILDYPSLIADLDAMLNTG